MVAERFPNSPSEAASTRELPNEGEVQRVRWTTSQFQQMGELDWFQGRHAELIEGEIYQMTVGTPHFASVMRASRALNQAFGAGFYVRPQGPLHLNENTDPEPDVCVVRGDIDDYLEAHPTASQALLVVEISDATLRRDQTVKASLYARADIPEVWIVNLQERQLEVHRAPQEKSDAPFGHAYNDVRVLAESEKIAPLHAGTSPVAVADLLP